MADPVTVLEVQNHKEFMRFVSFANHLYAGNEYFVPDLISEERQMFNPRKNPAYEYCETRMFLAYKDGVPVGRIAGIYHRGHIAKTGKRQLRFTRFDADNDFEISKALFYQLHIWAKQLQLEEIIGPIGFCDFDKQGLLIEGFGERSMYITAYNAPYYADHLVRLGFSKDADWVEYQISAVYDQQRLETLAHNVVKRYGFKMATYRSKRAARSAIPDLCSIVNAAFMDLYGFVPLTDEQMQMYINRYYHIIQLDYFYDVRNPDGNMIGFGLALPSLSQAIQRSKGRLFPLGFLRIMQALKCTNVLDCYLIAVKPEYQYKGVSALILQKAMETVLQKGIKMGETGPILESNTKMASLLKLFDVRQHNRRRCYVCKVESSYS